MQSYKNIEIILVDDGSTDESSAICDYYAGLDCRITVIHKANGGVTSARKAGISLASGDYILAVDGDDWIEEERINELVIKAIMPVHADMVYMAGYKKDYGINSQTLYGEIVEKTYFGNEIEEKIFLLDCGMGDELFTTKIISSMSMWAIKRSLLQEKQRYIDDRIIMAEDEVLLWFCLLSADSVTVIKQSGYHYVQRDSSATHITLDYGSDYYVKSTNIMYHQLKQYIKKYSKNSEIIEKVFICVIIKLAISLHYNMLLEKQTEYLYPFPKVKKGCRIVVYGAGKMGCSLMKYLLNSKDYQVMLWVDQNVRSILRLEYKISPVKHINCIEYDYIVIAVMDANVSKEIKENLMDIGIMEEKIARIDPSVITEDVLPDEICENKYLNY